MVIPSASPTDRPRPVSRRTTLEWIWLGLFTSIPTSAAITWWWLRRWPPDPQWPPLAGILFVALGLVDYAMALWPLAEAQRMLLSAQPWPVVAPSREVRAESARRVQSLLVISMALLEAPVVFGAVYSVGTGSPLLLMSFSLLSVIGLLALRLVALPRLLAAMDELEAGR